MLSLSSFASSSAASLMAFLNRSSSSAGEAFASQEIWAAVKIFCSASAALETCVGSPRRNLLAQPLVLGANGYGHMRLYRS